MKKLLSLVLVAGFLGVVTGCTSEAPKPKTTPPPTPPTGGKMEPAPKDAPPPEKGKDAKDKP